MIDLIDFFEQAGIREKLYEIIPTFKKLTPLQDLCFGSYHRAYVSIPSVPVCTGFVDIFKRP